MYNCYFVGYSPYSNFDFNVTHKKKYNTDSTKEDVFYTFTSDNSQTIFKCGIFHHPGCGFTGYNLSLKSSVLIIVPCYH